MTATPLSLLARIRQQARPQDWERMCGLYTPLLRSWLRRYPVQGADADDLVQEVLSVLFEKLPIFTHSGRAGAFRTWLRRILVYQIRYFLRMKNRGHPLPAGKADLFLDQLESPDSELARQWDLEHDSHIMRQMLALVRGEFTCTTWQAFERYALQGCPPREVAETLGVTVNAVLIARSRVLRRLREEAKELLD
jgi:RNA polymerase sigma-70 factor (ECF subfamily)